MGVNLLFSRKHLAFLHTALSICHPNVNTSCSLLSHGTNADSWELMQRASVFTVFIKALSACHVNTPLTLTFEQKMKVSPGSPRTKIGHPFWTTASSPRRKTAGAAAMLRLRGRGSSEPQTTTPAGITRHQRPLHHPCTPGQASASQTSLTSSPSFK